MSDSLIQEPTGNYIQKRKGGILNNRKRKLFIIGLNLVLLAALVLFVNFVKSQRAKKEIAFYETSKWTAEKETKIEPKKEVCDFSVFANSVFTRKSDNWFSLSTANCSVCFEITEKEGGEWTFKMLKDRELILSIQLIPHTLEDNVTGLTYNAVQLGPNAVSLLESARASDLNIEHFIRKAFSVLETRVQTLNFNLNLETVNDDYVIRSSSGTSLVVIPRSYIKLPLNK